MKGDEGQMAVPPDGGWGWVIVAVSFFCCAIVDGMVSVFGVLFQQLVIYYEASPSQLALAGSFLPGFFLLSGPFVSICINTFGCRFTTILGGLISSTAFFSSIFASNSILFIFSFGLCGGIGLGLIYLPASVMVGYYFENKRGLAAGISCAGAGAGILILSPLAAYLSDFYSHRGCIMIMAGICLNCVVCGALMRPIRFKSNKSFNVTHIRKLTLPSLPEVVNEVDEMEDLKLNNKIIFMESLCNLNDDQPKESFLLANKHDVMHHLHLNPSSIKDIHSIQYSSKRSSLHSAIEFQSGGKSRGSSHLSLMFGDVDMPLKKKDVLYGSSIASLHLNESYHERISNKNEDTHKEAENGFNNKKSKKHAMLSFIKKLKLDFLFKPTFVILCLSNICIQLAFFIPILFIPMFVEASGHNSSWGAYLLSILGFSNMIGRGVSGGLASLPQVNILHYNCLCLLACGILTLIFIINQSLVYFIIYSLLYGYLIAAFIPLTTIFLVKYIGLELLTSSFGFLCLIKGIATLAGPPIAGKLFVMTNSYNLTFTFAAILLILSTFFYYCLPITFDKKNWRKEYSICYQ